MLNVYICGTYINPMKDLLDENVYKKIISSPNNQKSFIFKNEFDEKISFYMYYLGRNDIGEKHQEYISTNCCVILTFLDKEKNINILKSYSEKKMMNNMHPFFIFYSLNFNKQNIVDDINNYYNRNKIKKNFQTSILNISIVKSKDDIVKELFKKYTYYNFVESKLYKDVYIFPINIGVYGKTKAGKSTFINKILGEKKSFEHPTKPTPKTLHFEHSNVPLVFFDTEGFDEEKSLINASKLIDKTFENLKSEIHIIYLVMNFENRLEEKERRFLTAHKDCLDRIIFIGTHGEDLHEQFIFKLKQDFKENNIYNEYEFESIKNNIFCLDLLEDEECNIQEIKNILKRTFELCNKYYKLIKDKSFEYEKSVFNQDEKSLGFERVKRQREEKGKEIINSRSWKAFGCGFIPFPLLDKYCMQQQMKKMVEELVTLYRDCKEQINKDEQLAVIISKTLGISIAGIGGAVSTVQLLGSTTGTAGAAAGTAGAAAGTAGAAAGTAGTAAGTAGTAAGTAGSTALATAGKIAGGIGIGVLIAGVVGIISGSIGKKDCENYGNIILEKFSKLFSEGYEHENYINVNYDNYVQSIEKSKKIIDFFKPDQTYDYSLYN